MNSFFAQLEERARRTGSLLCVGLDPHPADLPAPTAQAARDFCLRLVEATQEYALAFKPNSAFFEAFGAPGWEALKAVLAAIPAGIPVILDAKRGDIASTAEAYARAAFEELGVQAITLNPYLGYDATEPFLRMPERGAFLLCKTSNPGSADLQDLRLCGGLAVYQKVAVLAQEWNRHDNLGLVVGATHPQALAEVRRLAPALWFLAPGVGAQGGDLLAALQAGLRADGLGLLIPVSRAISRAADPRQAAAALVTEIRSAIATIAPGSTSSTPALPAGMPEALLRAGCVRFGNFTLKSGLQSPIYLDLRQLVGYPEILAQAAACYLPILSSLRYDLLAALPYAALPIGTAISLQNGKPMIYPRKEVKTYGTRAAIEGAFQPGQRAVIIDDLATTGESKFKIIAQLTQAGLEVQDVVVLVDRQSGAAEAMARSGFRLHAAMTLSSLLDYWQVTGDVPGEHIQTVRRFLQENP